MKNLCTMCPRNCKIDRTKHIGFCKNSENLKINKLMKHYWEEPIISGTNGSGTIFFSGCNLQCIYCQNYLISSLNKGTDISIEKFVEILKEIDNSEVNNINLVTPTHFTEQIIEALNIYKPQKPIVWNTSGYESVETIKNLKNYVDIYLTDLKYFDTNLSKELSNSEDYFEKCSKAILEMRKNQTNDIIENGIMKKGLIVRHLALPNCTKDSLNIINWINQNLGSNTIFSLMNQYTPYFKALTNNKLNRKLNNLEYKILVNECIKLNMLNTFTQSNESANTCYIPDFDNNFNDFKLN